MSTFLILLGVAAFAVGCGAMHYLHRRRLNSLADEWASANGFSILSRKIDASGDSETFCKVVVRDGLGRDRTGYLRTLGMCPRSVDVRWDSRR